MGVCPTGKKGKTMNPIAEIYIVYFQIERNEPVVLGKEPGIPL